MKTLGMLGGMSWESTIPYYKKINEQVRNVLGGLHSAKIILYSVDFHEIEKLQSHGEWECAGKLLATASVSLRDAGAEVLVICTNTMHKVANIIEISSGLPIIHIADATGEQISHDGISRVGLLGTRFTMEQDFYKGRLLKKYGIEVIIPEYQDRSIVHNIIYNELCLGNVNESSRNEYRRIIRSLELSGAQGIIFGCTEIGLLVNKNDASTPVYDTTDIHARAAANYIIGT
ncbi:aspartate/glutamate racemase family protein [Serratia bockelmannii]|uniref:aspartate/glutamate racemase family protein n=1 Tax=Serratia bockelmannii TaxID=2703793 RepID=UPI00313EC420